MAILKIYNPNQPLNIDTSCQVWLDGNDADTFTLDGTYVDQWDDKSGFGRDVSNGNADVTRPTYDSATGRVTFTAANNTFLQSAAFASALSQPNIVFIVYKKTGSLSSIEIIFDGIGGSERHTFSTVSSFFKFGAGTSIAGTATNANDNIHIALFNEASSEYWINGISVASGNAGDDNLSGVILGATYNFGGDADAEIMEVIVYSADISNADRDKITGYLADKWDITATTDFKGYVLQI